MTAPCSVKARGAYLIFAPQLKVTDCDLEISSLRGGSAPNVTDCDLERDAARASSSGVLLRLAPQPRLAHVYKMPAAPSDVSAALAGRYVIERELGQGGMATVFLATDLKHDRKVAIKVLKPELAAVLGAERFVQESKTTAALSHPHILPLFDSGEASGFLYYVMPFIEGETIRERLNRETQFGVDEAVRIAREVADALDYAHRHGVIHRDIKPENVLLHDGRPMVMDFGIALAVSAAAGGRMTETGLSLGTPHYMSPEQATAEKEITARSDVYSLGSVLYEMLAGVPPHEGGSAQQVIMRIIADTPRPVTEIRKTTPPNVAAALAKALEKLPADRFESAKAFADALANRDFMYTAARGGTGVFGAASGATSTGAWLRDVRTMVAAGVIVMLGAVLAWNSRSPGDAVDAIADRPDYHFTLLDSSSRTWPAIAPDGSVWIAEPAPGEPGRVTYRVRRHGATKWADVATDDARSAFIAVSRDGRRAAYARPAASGMEIRALSAESREHTLLATLAGQTNAFVTDWSDDGFIYVFAQDSTGLLGALNLRLPETGGARIDTIPLPAASGRFAGFMKSIPGTDVILYAETVAGGAFGLVDGRIMAFHLRTRDTLFVVNGVITAWSPTGHVLVGREGGFIDAVPFDSRAFRVTGPPRQVLAGVVGAGPVVWFAGSQAGALTYVGGPVADNPESMRELRWRGLDGTSERIALPAADHNDAAVSPDGARIAYVRKGRVWVFDSRSGRNAPLSDDTLGTNEHDPLWSPDGRRLAFGSKRSGMKDDHGDVYVQPADGSGPAVRVGGAKGQDAPRQWLSDSTVLFIAQAPAGGGSRAQWDVYTAVLGRPGSEKAVLESPFDELDPSVDPSGRWIVYTSDQDGSTGLYVRRYPSLENPVRVATPGAGRFNVMGRAAWGAEGRSVYYESAQDSLVRVTLDLSGDRARVVSQSAVLGLGRGHNEITDRHPTNGRLLQWVDAGADAEPAPPKLILIVNFDQVIRRVMAEGPATP